MRYFSLILALLPLCVQAEAVLEAKQVAQDAYYVQGQSALGSTLNQNFISNAGFVIGKTGVIVIDALGSPVIAEKLIAEIGKLTKLPITDVIVTHYHADHIYGLQAFKKLGARIIAHAEGREYLNSDTARLRLETSRKELAPWVDAQTQLVFADEWLTGSAAVQRQMAGLDLVMQMLGPAHTPEDIAVYFPAQKVLYAGDLLFRGRLPFVGQANSKHWIDSLDTLLGFDATVVVPGHGGASTSPKADMQLTRDYLAYLRQTMGEAVKTFTPFDEAYQNTDWSRFEKIPMFGPANRMNAYNTYLLMEKEAF